MKQILSLSIILFALSAQAQPLEPVQAKKIIPYKAVIDLNDGMVAKGWLYQAEPDQIILRTGKIKTGKFYTLTPEQIDRIKIYRKAHVGRGALFGALVGMAIGAVAGYASGDDENCDWCFMYYTAGEKALIYGFVGMELGGAIGTAIGALSKKTFLIKGKKENYIQNYQAIVEKAMIRQ